MACEDLNDGNWNPLGGRRSSDTLWQVLFLGLAAGLIFLLYSTLSELREFGDWRKDMEAASECYRRGSKSGSPGDI